MPTLGFPKPPPRRRKPWRRIKTRRHPEAHNAAVTATRAEVFRLDIVCVACGKRQQPTDEMHEVLSRSKTRGRPPAERFNRRICCRLHRQCHHDVTEHRMELAFLDHELGMDGGLIVQRRGDAEAVVYRRGHEPAHSTAGRGCARRGVWTPTGDVGGTDA